MHQKNLDQPALNHSTEPKMLKIIPNLTVWTDEPDSPEPDMTDPFACDEFRIYEFKVRRCARGRAHDWTDCPYAHPGEKARRRDPRRFHYSGTPCPDFKKGGACERGDACEFAHGVFECWLHPARYRTQPCKDGTACRRRVCFFAHTPDQLRLLSPRSPAATPDCYDGSPMTMRMKNNNCNSGVGAGIGSSPTSILSPASYSECYSSPPVSPDGGLVMMMRRMNLCGSLPSSSPMARRMVGFEIEEENNNINDGFDGIDVGWISELVK